MKVGRKKRIALGITVTIISIFMAIGVTVPVLLDMINKDIIRDIEIRNPGGLNGTALVVFRPGISSFPDEMIDGLADGLVDNDWRVDITTAHQNTPTNATSYDLLVIGSPVYGDTPHASVIDYLGRIDLAGMQTIILLTCGGSAANATIMLRNAVLAANGTIIDEVLLYQNQQNQGAIAYGIGHDFMPVP